MKIFALAVCAMLLILPGCTKKFSAMSLNSNGTKVIHAFRTQSFKSLDPPKQFDNASSDIIINVFDTLLEYSYLQRPYELTPLLLETMPQVEADGLTYTFTLKKNVYFQDDPAFPKGKGKELTADDVIYTMKRFSDINVNVLSYSLLQGFIVGLDEFRQLTQSKGRTGIDYDKFSVEGLSKIDRYKFSIKFTKASGLAMHVLAFSGLAIVAKEVIEYYGTEVDQHPVGTGPFYLKSFSFRGNLLLAKNSKYHQKYPSGGSELDRDNGLQEAKGKQMPFVDEVQLPLMEESRAATLNFLQGELDIMVMSKDFFTEMAYKDEDGQFYLKRKFKDKYQLYFGTLPSINYLKFNMEDELIGKNKFLRQAIAHATDSVSSVDLLNNGRGEILDSIVPPSIIGHGKMIHSVSWPRQNLRVASDLLKQAGFPRGKGLPDITIEFSSTTREARYSFEFLRNEYAKIGVNLKANFQSFSAFLHRMESGNFQMANSAWLADYPDAESLYAVLYSKNKAPGPNEGNYSNAEYDALYEKIRFMPNGDERFLLFTKMNQLILDDVPIVLQDAPITVGLLQGRIRNFKFNSLTGTSYKYLDTDAR